MKLDFFFFFFSNELNSPRRQSKPLIVSRMNTLKKRNLIFFDIKILICVGVQEKECIHRKKPYPSSSQYDSHSKLLHPKLKEIVA